MAPEREKILIVSPDAASRGSLLDLVRLAGYEASTVGSASDALEAIRDGGPDLLLLDGDITDSNLGAALSEVKGSSATAGTRVIVLADGGATERSRALDLGADDVMGRPWEEAELLARLRTQLRAKHALDALREKTRLAEEGQEIAHTAFQALAVTEKMTRDAFSLNRMLKIGVTAALLVAAAMAAVFFLYSRRANRETTQAYAVIARLERGLNKREDLVALARKTREEMEQSASAAPGERNQLEKRSAELSAKIAGDGGADLPALRQQLAQTSARLRRIEGESSVAEGIIRSYASSVCLLHVAVGFREKRSGERVRYAGINPQGEPLQDSEGRTLYAVSGRGPEVRADFFGTGFLAAHGGRILTNHHVVQPWWKNDELESMASQGIEPVIAEINAYFPDDPRSYRVEIQKISADADLAVVQGELSDLKRPMLELDGSKDAAVSGQPIVSVGYATGLTAILARAGEDNVNAIARSTDGSPKQVLAEVARRKLIHPLNTQGHIGDVLRDQLIYDAQTTSGGSGGPLFNQQGKVIGVTFAVVRGFGGSNFGVPIRFAFPLLSK